MPLIGLQIFSLCIVTLVLVSAQDVVFGDSESNTDYRYSHNNNQNSRTGGRSVESANTRSNAYMRGYQNPKTLVRAPSPPEDRDGSSGNFENGPAANTRSSQSRLTSTQSPPEESDEQHHSSGSQFENGPADNTRSGKASQPSNTYGYGSSQQSNNQYSTGPAANTRNSQNNANQPGNDYGYGASQQTNNQYSSGPAANTRNSQKDTSQSPSYYCNIKTIDNVCIFENLNINADDKVYFGTEENQDQRVAFKDSTLRYLPKNLILAFPYLQVLYLENLGLSTIERDALQTADALEELYLNNNLLQFLSQQTFVGVNALKIIRLSSNSISRIHENIFMQNSALQEVYLEGNKIKKIPKLHNNAELLAINASHNQLINLEPDQFSYNRKLQQVDVSFNNLQDFNLQQLNQASYLRFVDVSFNQLQTLNIPKFVQSLHAKNNSIDKVITGQYCNLISLDLTSNELQSVDLTNCRYLKSLELSHNVLKEFNFNLVNSQLENLNLANNHLFVLILPSTYTSLKTLDLSNNFLVYIPNTSVFGQLQHLRLNNNKLITFDFSALPYLQSVYISNNDWDCGTLVGIYDRVMDRHNNHCIRDRFTNSHGICCRSYTRPFNQRLNEIIQSIDFQEKQNLEKLKEQCDSRRNPEANNFRPEDIEQLRAEAARSDSEKRNLLQRLAKIREEQTNLHTRTNGIERELFEYNNQWKQLTAEIEKQRSLHGVLKEGLESPQEIIEKLVEFAKSRDQVHSDVLARRIDETDKIEAQLSDLKHMKETLQRDLVQLQADYDMLGPQAKELKKEKDKLERQANRNAPSIQGRG